MKDVKFLVRKDLRQIEWEPISVERYDTNSRRANCS